MEYLDTNNAALEKVYRAYVGRAEGLESRVWVKLLKETEVVDKAFTTLDADLIFTKVKPKSSKSIDFSQFIEALKLVMDRKQLEEDEFLSIITATEGPQFVGTKTHDVRFHDDKSTYTGVHAHGGPQTTSSSGGLKGGLFSEYAKPKKGEDRGRRVNLQELCDRSPATVRGLNK